MDIIKWMKCLAVDYYRSRFYQCVHFGIDKKSRCDAFSIRNRKLLQLLGSDRRRNLSHSQAKISIPCSITVLKMMMHRQCFGG